MLRCPLSEATLQGKFTRNLYSRRKFSKHSPLIDRAFIGIFHLLLREKR